MPHSARKGDPSPENQNLPSRNYDDIDTVLKFFASVNPFGSSSDVMWYTMELLEEASVAQVHQKLYRVPIFAVGRLHKLTRSSSSLANLFREHMSCMELLNKQAPNPAIYGSLGSIALVLMIDEEVEAMAWGTVSRKKLEKRGMGATKANTPAIENIAEGHVLIGQPSFTEHIMNVRFLSWVWEIGTEMEGRFERREIESRIKSLMLHKEGRKLRQRAAKLKEEGSASSKTL